MDYDVTIFEENLAYEADLINGTTLYIGHVPGRSSIALGIPTITSVEVLAYFRNSEAAVRFIDLLRAPNAGR